LKLLTGFIRSLVFILLAGLLPVSDSAALINERTPLSLAHVERIQKDTIMKFLSRFFAPKPRKSRRRRYHNASTEALEPRQLLTVAFNFIWQGEIGDGQNPIGFEHPALGQGRRDALAAVAQQLGNQFTHTATIDVAVTSSENAKSTTLAEAGSNFANGTGMFGGIEVTRQKILTGNDINGTTADATVDVNWGQKWDISPNPLQVDATESDFYSTMTHELLHAVGFNSVINANGVGINGTNYTKFDQFLSTGNGAPIVNPNTGALDQAAFTKAYTGGSSFLKIDGVSQGLFFNGPLAAAANGGQPVGIFTAYNDQGSNNAHLDDENPTLQSAIMLSATLNGPGTRGLSMLDRAILQDFGFSLIQPDVVVTETPDGTYLTEGGASDTFTVQLAAAPQNNVVLNLTVGDGTKVSIDKQTLTFTPNNWNVAQTVTASALDDNSGPVNGGLDTSRIYIDVNQNQSGATYQNVMTSTVTVNVYDNDISAASPRISSIAGAGTGQPTFTWQAIPGVQTYEVLVNPIGSNQVAFQQRAINGTTFQLPQQLAANQNFQVQILSESNNLTTGYGPVAVFSTTPVNITTPGAITLNAPTNVAGGTPTFTWSADVNAATYDLWVDQIGGQLQIIRQQTLTGTTFTAQNNLPQGQYKAWVRASNAAGNGPWTVAQTFTIGTPPATIVLNDPTNTATGTPTFSWNAITGATQYDLWVNQVGGQTQIVRQQNVQGTTFTVSAQNALPNGAYRGWVRPITAGVPGNWSVAKDFSIGTALVAPVLNAPTGTATGTPTFTWNQVATATTYDLWVNQDGGTNQIIRQQTLNGTTFTAQNNLAIGVYTAWVRAAAGTVNGPWSAALKFNIGTAPGQVTVNAPVGQTTSTPTITWTTDPIAAGYELWVNQVGGQTKIIYNANVQATQFNVVNALQVGNYRVWVRAVSAQGLFGPWSAAVNFTV